MDKVRTYAPLIGSVIIVAVSVLRAIGQTEAADIIAQFGGGFIAQSSVGSEPIAAYIATSVGLFIKFRNEAAGK